MKLPEIEYKNCVVKITILPSEDKWVWKANIMNMQNLSQVVDKPLAIDQTYKTEQEAIDHAKSYVKNWIDQH